MADAVFKRKLDELLEPMMHRARDNGRTIEQEIEALSRQGRPYTPEERAAVSAYFLSQYPELQPSLTLDEIREGLM